MFILRNVRNTKLTCGKMQTSVMVHRVVHIVTTSYLLNYDGTVYRLRNSA